jgi:hypothetical protein
MISTLFSFFFLSQLFPANRGFYIGLKLKRISIKNVDLFQIIIVRALSFLQANDPQHYLPIPFFFFF